ncbi:MAG: multiple sugar transport system permease protein, partial [Microbacteriaceae bacterium]|nr:multiple sugar transport system permease protein [Microbacteriaceae bacterium]
MSTSTETSRTGSLAGSPYVAPPKRKRHPFGRSNPLGLLFSAPYLLFVLAVFAYPLGFAIYIAFHDYFFTAPGAVVSRPFVGL